MSTPGLAWKFLKSVTMLAFIRVPRLICPAFKKPFRVLYYPDGWQSRQARVNTGKSMTAGDSHSKIDRTEGRLAFTMK